MKYCTVLFLSTISGAIGTSFVDGEKEIKALAEN